MRIILFTGKGGVGKTTVCAATGVACARRGHRTLVMSLDIAHSLGDSFDLERSLMDDARGEPVAVADRLWIQEVDVEEEIRRHWGAIQGYIARLLHTSGLERILAEEIAILPGMEEVVALLFINRYAREERYDAVLLDCAPTGESLRFLSMPTALEWYMRKVFRVEKVMVGLSRPLAALYGVPLPERGYFDAIRGLYERLDGVQALLGDPAVTSARLVTNAEKMVVRETQRAFTYLCLYGVNVDAVVVNRMLSGEVGDGWFEEWKALQTKHLAAIEEFFRPVPVRTVPLWRREIVGPAALGALAEALYGTEDPTARLHEEAPLRFETVDGRPVMRLRLPFVSGQEVDLGRSGDELIVRIGGFKRHLLLPRSLAGREPLEAKLEGRELRVTFAGAGNAAETGVK
jgi:arsenite-transporting ATPase